MEHICFRCNFSADVKRRLGLMTTGLDIFLVRAIFISGFWTTRKYWWEQFQPNQERSLVIQSVSSIFFWPIHSFVIKLLGLADWPKTCVTKNNIVNLRRSIVGRVVDYQLRFGEIGIIRLKACSAFGINSWYLWAKNNICTSSMTK